MNEEQAGTEEDVFASWLVPEYHKHERNKRWYTIAVVFAIFLLLFSFLSNNFLLPFIMIIVSAIFIMQHGQEPPNVLISLSSDGIHVGNNFYDYDAFRHFSIVYKPKQDDKNLYFEFKNALRPRLSIPLMDIQPVKTRAYLAQFLDEDEERTDIPLSESLSKLLKL